MVAPTLNEAEAPPAALASSRRFAGRGSWRIVAGWIVIVALHRVGVDPQRLARLHRSERAAPRP